MHCTTHPSAASRSAWRSALRRANYVACAACVAAASLLVACASSHSAEQLGRVELALSSEAQGSTYELRDATFRIEGAESTSLSSEGSTEATLDAVLPVGDYTVELLDGWRLVETTADGAVDVVATLTSPNPVGFAISAEQTTTVSFAFQTQEGPVGLGEGTLVLGIDVQKLVAREVIFSEVMKNPAAVTDANGEWLELQNVGTEPVDLDGCVVRRDDTSFTISGSLVVEPGAQLTLANAAEPGFVPDYVYSSVSLPNTAAFTLELACGEELLDAVVVDPAAVSNAAGASLSLDPKFATATDNDAAEAWCDGAADYNAGDLGTPGMANPACP